MDGWLSQEKQKVTRRTDKREKLNSEKEQNDREGRALVGPKFLLSPAFMMRCPVLNKRQSNNAHALVEWLSVLQDLIFLV